MVVAQKAFNLGSTELAAVETSDIAKLVDLIFGEDAIAGMATSQTSDEAAVTIATQSSSFNPEEFGGLADGVGSVGLIGD